jgi:hypothetical protein
MFLETLRDNTIQSIGSTLNCVGFTILIVLLQHNNLLFLNHLRYLRSYKFDKHTALISHATHPYYDELIDLHL